MLEHARERARGASAAYAVARDFCRIFAEEMKGLYLLALLLTGEEASAERCFISALEDCQRATGVFQDWARSWSRRAIVQAALRMVKPSRDRAHQIAPAQAPASLANVALLAAVARLKAFDRFVYVASVLEGYSDQDCKVLLECTRQDIVRGRRRAMVTLGGSATSVPLPATANLKQMFAQAS